MVKNGPEFCWTLMVAAKFCWMVLDAAGWSWMALNGPEWTIMTSRMNLCFFYLSKKLFLNGLNGVKFPPTIWIKVHHKWTYMQKDLIVLCSRKQAHDIILS